MVVGCFSLILVASYLSAGWLYWLSFGNWKLSLAISISLKPAFCGWESRRWLMLMAGPIGLFRQRYPGVELKISEFGGLTVQQAVMNGELDMALTALPVEESGLTTLSLFSHPLCVLTPHSGKWLECDAVSPETLAEHPLLIYNEDFALSKQLMKLFDEHGVKPRIAVRSGQWDFLAAMVQAGVGIAILPEPICQRLDKNTLKWLPLESELSWKLGMIWREGVYLSHSAHAWLSCCEGYWLTPE